MFITSFQGNTGATSHHMDNCAEYRNKIFCGELGWDLNTQNGLETDQYDRDDTVYIYARDDNNDICGHARLLPTTKPYMIAEVFPHLMDGQPIPNSNAIWELSRFASTQQSSQLKSNPMIGRRLSHKLLDEAVDYVRKQGGDRLISASPVAVERMIQQAGYRASRVGPPKMIDNQAVIACWIHIPRN